MALADRIPRHDTLPHLPPRARALAAALAALGAVALALYAYRELPGRPFAADDYQWLLNVRGLDLRQVAGRAFDAGAQAHFYRPLVWLLFWAQARAFDLDPRGYHAVTLALHLLDAALLGALAHRLGVGRRAWPLALAFVALHPAPFEAITWISAQSELLAALLLLATLHLWLSGRDAGGAVPRAATWLLATLCLGLALLAKESAAIGLPLLALIGARPPGAARPGLLARAAPYLPPALLTAGYAVIQVGVERRNYLVSGGGYGLGPQLLLNPLRSLALVVAPLSGTEHADSAWLVPLGAAVALGLAALALRGGWGTRRLLLALLLTLLPTAPFAAPPNSRYLYLPVMAAALLLAGAWERALPSAARRSVVARWSLVAGRWLLVVLLAWAAARELGVREWRFAAGSGPGGSLWRAATAFCADGAPQQVLVVDPPLAPQHAEAIIQLACGPDVRPLVVSRDQVAGALAPGSVVVGFQGGSAVVEQRT